MKIVAADIGGTHARFALAEIVDGQVASLREAVTMRTAEHANLRMAWEAFARTVGGPLPPAAAIAVAGPVQTETLTLTNTAWVIRPGSLAQELGLEALTLINDFAAVGHTVAMAAPGILSPLCGPEGPVPSSGVTAVLGPGTGLGVAFVLRAAGSTVVTPTEGGHIAFAPVDAVDDAIVLRLRGRFRRVSAERVVSGPGLANIHACLAAVEGRAVMPRDDGALWSAAIDGDDSLAGAALERFCLSLGSVAGDIALAQGANAVVLAGGLVRRIRGKLAASGFRDRFISKGRFERMMDSIPVRVLEHAQPGLFGAAAAFATEARGVRHG